MNIDIAQFHQVFFEESIEGIEIMETGLLNLELGSVDFESINTIFRAAHSIKGGAGTFGFTNLANFTHVMETLLDLMRDQKCTVTREIVDVLLLGVDVLKDIINSDQHGQDYDIQKANSVQQELQRLLKNESVAKQVAYTSQSDDSLDEVSKSKTYQLIFKPYKHLLQTGNEPSRIFQELATLGEVSITSDVSGLVNNNEYHPEECLLSWRIILTTPKPIDEINNVFAWVDGDCTLDINEVDSAGDAGHTQSTLLSEIVTTTTESKATNTTTNLQAIPTSESKISEERKKNSTTANEQASIRVNTDKIDTLINLVGELVITQSILSQFGEGVELENNLDKLRDGLAQLARNTRQIQEGILSIRMLPISFSFNRFTRLIRDLSSKLDKNVELVVTGEQTEIDKTVLEKISDPLVHLVRNSLDHGIEKPDVRLAKGKSAHGTLHLNAFHEGGNIVIQIIDDGAGLNRDRILARAKERGLVGENEILTDDKIYELIFQPGFSTAEAVTDVSGRGVGMDVVRRNIKDLGGAIEIKSKTDVGTTFTIRLPLTLAILDAQLVKVGHTIYIIPLISIIESLQVETQRVKTVTQNSELYKLREEYIPIIRLYQVFNIGTSVRTLKDGLLVVVEGDGKKVGIFVDDLLAQQQVVIKSLETNYQRIQGVSGATILGDGTVALIIDISGLIAMSQVNEQLTQCSENNFLTERAA